MTGAYPPKDAKTGAELLPWFDETASPSNTSQAAILAILAHELGHVLLADTNADDSGTRHTHPRPCDQPAEKCFDKAFLGAPPGTSHWNKKFFVQTSGGGSFFGDQNNNKHLNTKVDFGQVKAFLHPQTPNQPDYASAAKAIRNIYDADSSACWRPFLQRKTS